MIELNQIKKLAKKRGIKLKDIAKALDYEYSGFYRAITKDSLNYPARIQLASILGIDIETLMGGSDLSESKLEKLLNKIDDKSAQKEGDNSVISNNEMLDQLMKEVFELKYKVRILTEDVERLRGLVEKKSW
jgi:transcriptional regulator with XRE-family HTH domain